MGRVQFLAVSLAVACSAVVGIIYAITPHHHIQQEGTHTGTITGRVVDGEGKPIAGAMVYADRNGFPMGRRPDALTDEHGAFSFKNLAPGIYTVSADKEEDAYPSSDSVFYAVGALDIIRVDVYEQQTTSNVIVHFT